MAGAGHHIEDMVAVPNAARGQYFSGMAASVQREGIGATMTSNAAK